MNTFWYGNVDGKPMIRSGFRLVAGLMFWALMAVALAMNGKLWPLSGFWMVALCSLAIGQVALRCGAPACSSFFRAHVTLPTVDPAPLIASLKPAFWIGALISVTLAVRAFNEFNH